MGAAVKGSGSSGGGKRGHRSSKSFDIPPPKREYDSPLDVAKGYEVVWPQVADLFQSARRVEACNFVYVIGEYEDKGPIKIGVAKDPIKRLRQMQTGNPRRLRIEWVLLGFSDTEKLLHEFWEPYAIQSLSKRGKVGAAPGTEWFRREIRSEIYPILRTAADAQVQWLSGQEGDIHSDQTELLIRQAHIAHGFVAQGRDEVRLLRRGAGYVVPTRHSRI